MATKEKKDKSPAKKPKRSKWSRKEKLLIQSKYAVHSRFGANAESRKRFKAQSPSLTAVQQRVVSDLSSRGIAMAHFTELVGDDALWQELSRDMERYASETEATLEKGNYDKKVRGGRLSGAQRLAPGGDPDRQLVASARGWSEDPRYGERLSRVLDKVDRPGAVVHDPDA